MSEYIALIHKERDSDYGVSFPDFPGCVTAGNTLDEARVMAREALSFHMQGMIEDGDQIPEPSSLDQIMEDLSNRDAVAVLIEAAPDNQTISVKVDIPERDLLAIDSYAHDHGLSRSGLLVKAARLAIEDKRL